jgi:DNA-binding transcriptional ArsR family regulator
MAKDLDHVWKALADPTRRDILDLLREGPKQTTEIVEKFPALSRFGVMKHLESLRAAGLVLTRADGRRRINSLNVAPIRQLMERWISKYEAYWTNTLLRVRDAAEDEQSGRNNAKGRRA